MTLEVITRRPASPSSKPPILCLHGAYHGAWCWEEHFLSFFAEHGYEAVAFSLRGHGASAGRERLASFGLADYLEDVSRMAETFDRPPVLFGHSLGGLLALMLLERRAAAAAVLLAPAPVGYLRHDALRWLLRHPWASITAFLTRDMRRLLPTFRRHFFSPRTPPALVDRFMARMQEESFRVLTDQARLPPPRLANPETPLLVLHGTYDSIRLDQHQALARQYNADLKVFPLGHELMLEPEWPEVAGAILAWLSERGL